MSDGPFENTDIELWRETRDDYYAPSIFVTQEGSIGINVGGLCIVKPVRDWHLLAAADENLPCSLGATLGPES